MELPSPVEDLMMKSRCCLERKWKMSQAVLSALAADGSCETATFLSVVRKGP